MAAASPFYDKIVLTRGANSRTSYHDNVLIYPNPATDMLWVDAPFPVKKLEITGQSGRIVILKHDIAGGVDVTGLPSGCYFL